MSEIRTQKLEMRSRYLEVRKEIPEELRAAWDEKIFTRLRASITYRHSKDILLYASTQDEVDTKRIFECAIGDGKRVAFPVCDPETNTMTYRYVKSMDELTGKYYDIPEPSEECEICVPDNFTICIVPGLVFDKDGYRIGYGKGYYDRFLSAFGGVSIGLVYSQLLLPRVPKGRFDRHVDVIISEKGVYAVNAPK